MGKLKVGDKARILTGFWKDHVGIITEAVEQDDERGIQESYVIKTEEKSFGMRYYACALEKVKDLGTIDIFEESLNTPSVDAGEYMGEMATIVSDTKRGLNIFVNPDPNRIGVPCFKVCNTVIRQKGRSKIARLHFKDTGMSFHTGDGFADWNPNSRELASIKKALLAMDEDMPKYTIWQMACYKWNLEYFQGAIGSATRYFRGDYDQRFKDHPSYVPSTQQMPETWIYDPPKGKGRHN